jgi:ABC-2 type transport system permease protein
MPRFIQSVTYVIPARYYIVILRDLFLKGVGMASMWDETLFLFLFAVIMINFAVRKFEKKVV